MQVYLRLAALSWLLFACSANDGSQLTDAATDSDAFEQPTDVAIEPESDEASPDGPQDCTPPWQLAEPPLSDDTPGRVATACAGAEGRAIGDLATYDRVAADWSAILAYDGRIPSDVDIPGVEESVNELRVRLHCDAYAQAREGHHEEWACATRDLRIASVHWDDDHCIVVLTFHGVYAHSVLSEVLGAVGGVDRVVEHVVESGLQALQATLEPDVGYYFARIGLLNGPFNYYTYRVDEAGPVLIAESCDWPAGGFCRVGEGPEVVPAGGPDEWQCRP
jgi:hypothetical protein